MTDLRCEACGSELDPSADRCPACGAQASVGADVTAAFSPVTEAEEHVEALAVEPGAGPALVVKKGPDAGERFVLEGATISIGRDPASDIFLNDITVSRRHARIQITDEGVVLSDVGSLNGTYVNGERIEASALSSGDEIQIGKFRLAFTP